MPLHLRDDCLPLERRDVYLTLICYFRNTCNTEELFVQVVNLFQWDTFEGTIIEIEINTKVGI